MAELISEIVAFWSKFVVVTPTCCEYLIETMEEFVSLKVPILTAIHLPPSNCEENFRTSYQTPTKLLMTKFRMGVTEPVHPGVDCSMFMIALVRIKKAKKQSANNFIIDDEMPAFDGEFQFYFSFDNKRITSWTIFYNIGETKHRTSLTHLYSNIFFITLGETLQNFISRFSASKALPLQCIVSDCLVSIDSFLILELPGRW